MKRVDLTEEPAVRLARMLQAQDARLGRLETRPTGVKHLGQDGDIVWDGPGWVPDPADPDGPLIPGPSYQTWSVKEVPKLTETLGRDLETAETRIGQARQDLAGMQDAIESVSLDIEGLNGSIGQAAADAAAAQQAAVDAQAAATQAAQDAQDALEAAMNASGKQQVYFGTQPPVGDPDVLWINPDGVPHQWAGTPPDTGEWVPIDDARIVAAAQAAQAARDDAAAALAAAQAAQAAADDARAAADDAADAAAQALTSASGRNSRIISLTTPGGTTNPTTGLPLVAGDSWWRWDNTTDRNVIGAWVWDGDSWEPETLADSVLGSLDVNKLLVLGTARITEAVVQKIMGDAAYFNLINVEDLTVTDTATINELVAAKIAAAQITLQVLRSEIDEATGLYAIFDSFGLRVIDNDGPNNEGNPETVVALGPNADMLIELGTGRNKVSINSSGIGSFRTVEANEFRLSGQTVPDMMWPYTRGVVASGVIPRGNSTIRRQSRGIIMGVDARLSPGRIYSIRTNQLSVTRQNAASRPIPMLHVTLDGTDPSLDWDGTAVAEAPGVPNAVTQSIAHPGMEHIVDLRHIYRTLPTRLCRIAVTLADQSNLGWVQGSTGRGAFYCIVRDEGPEMPDTGAIWLDNNVTPPPALRRYSARYWANGIACYVRGGGRDDSQGFVQGRYSNWNRETFIFYPDMTADLAGATIHSIRAFSWFDHWYNNAGGTGSWCWHGHTSIPAGGGQFANYMRDEPGWPRAAGRTAEIVPGEFNDWKTGVRRGIAFSTGNTSLEFYGKLSGLVGVNGAHFIDVEYSK